ncbi:MAG: 2-C-methyl-D-erythritol 4-phosphate cytidylyltransferase [Dehalococcoidia bacterium]|nr:2-C-methyl-D-erythritol 4-phosphate cytidylyltransferase [Dehalococcoidia bacterium]MDD5493242.1 2-C-methyl-D-erythritol 4-phosphate cytidylyltransferase [Dehalococcoidia bacterium]
MSDHAKVSAIVVSAGKGRRMGADKTFLTLYDKPLIAWSVDVLQRSRLIDEIVLVLHKDNVHSGNDLVAVYKWSKVVQVCAGGEHRQDSVKNGLDHVNECHWVMIHDGARPFLTERLISDGLETVKLTGAAIAAVPVKDTVKMTDGNDTVSQTIDRKHLMSIQTPQIFRRDIVMKAYELVNSEVTDDSSLVEKAGFKVKIYPGDYNNLKVTTPEDITLAEAIARRR